MRQIVCVMIKTSDIRPEIRTKQPEAIDQRSKIVYLIDLNPPYPIQNNWGGEGLWGVNVV